MRSQCEVAALQVLSLASGPTKGQSNVGMTLAFLKGEPPESQFPAASFLGMGSGTPARAALVLLVPGYPLPGYDQCHPLALSSQSSACGHIFDIYPVI